MDEFKLRPGEQEEIFDLTEDIYFEKTNRQSPYKNRSLSNGQATMYFATCPECENPIEIRNLVKDGAVGDPYPDKVYGQHYLHFHPEIMSLARNGQIDRNAYDDCSYAGDRTLTKNGAIRKNNTINDRMLLLLAEHACLIKKLINPCLGVNMGDGLFLEIIDEFVCGGGYRHRAATTRNLPYAIAFMSEKQSLVGQYIRDDAVDLQEAIVKSNWFELVEGRISRRKRSDVPVDANLGFFFSRFRAAGYGTGDQNRMRFNVKVFKGKEEIDVLYKTDREFYDCDFRHAVRDNRPRVSIEQKQRVSDIAKAIILRHRPDFNFDQPIQF